MAFTDNFTGTNGDDLVGRSGWTQQEGTSPQKWVVDTNAIKPDATGSYCSYTCTDQGSADQYVQVKLSALTAAPYGFLATRLVDHNNFIGFRIFGTGSIGARLVKCVSGVVTDLVTFQGAANDVYKIEANGSTIKLFKNGTQQGTDQTVTNFTTETSQGLLTTANQTITGPLFDDFEAGALAGGGSVGSSSGTSTTTATGSSTFASSGSSSGAGSASAQGLTTFSSSGTSSGQSTSLASGRSTFASSGTIAGQGSASSTGSATAAGSGASSGTATVNGIASGGSIQSGAGASAGQSTALASGSSLFASSGISAGQGSALSTGSAIAAGSGASSGAATISGIAPGLSIVSGAGISVGTSVAVSIATWIFKSNGIASGNSTAFAYSIASSSFSDQRYVLTSESKDFSITSKPDELIFYS